MKRNILITMGILILTGFAVQGFVGAIGGLLLTTLVGIVYGTAKKDKKLVKWSASALLITIFCTMICYFCIMALNGGHPAKGM